MGTMMTQQEMKARNLHNQNAQGHSNPDHKTEEGKPDHRFKENRTNGQDDSQDDAVLVREENKDQAPGFISLRGRRKGRIVQEDNAAMRDGNFNHLTKVGKPDRRYKGQRDLEDDGVINPDYTKARTGPQTEDGVHLTKSGTVDRRFLEGRAIDAETAKIEGAKRLLKEAGITNIDLASMVLPETGRLRLSRLFYLISLKMI